MRAKYKPNIEGGYMKKKPLVTVSKEQYKKKAQKRNPQELKRDYMRTKKNAVKGSKAELKEGWDSKKYDWIGIDAMTPAERREHQQKTYKNPMRHTKSTRYDDSMYDKKAYRDSSLTRSERADEDRERHSLRNMSLYW